ncbi:MAG: fluoride efflux transporter CrcB [Saprospiraceae bacterium]
MVNFLWVFIGGGLGSICRYGIAEVVKPYDLTFPYATLLANVLACVVLGAMVGWSLKLDLSMNIRLLIMTGFCGGFSTFSTFTYETFALFEQGKLNLAFANIGVSLLVCLGAIYLGIRISNI